MRREMLRLRAGEINFAEFAAVTRNDWRAMAHAMHAKWRLPDAVEPCDVEQEMLAECWRAIPLWREGGGKPIDKWVVYRCHAYAKDWIHKQRNAYRRRGTSPSRLELPFSTFGDGEVDFDFALWTDGQQDRVVDARENLDAALGDCSREQRECVVAFIKAKTCGDLAGSLVYKKGWLRRALKLRSKKDGARAVRRALRQVAEQTA